MTLLLDLSEGKRPPMEADVLAILYHEGNADLPHSIGGAPWYRLIDEDSTARLSS